MISLLNTNYISSYNSNGRSHSAQGMSIVSPMKIPLPPRMWITDVSDESSDEMGAGVREDNVVHSTDRSRVRSRFRHHRTRSTAPIPIGIFWDIENCQVPRGCSALDVVTAIRTKFLTGRREADFVVVCDVRKELPLRLQELNDAQVSLIHVCGTQKNAADEKLRQCMRRFGELHSAPAALCLISGDINFAGDLSDFRHRKNMEVILVHKQNTSSALIACASSHVCYNDLTANLPRNAKSLSQSQEEEQPSCEMEVVNLPICQPPERVSRRLRRLADNCGGKVVKVTNDTAMLKFPTPDHALRALKRMDGEDVFGRKISTRYARVACPPHYSSDEGYSTAPPQQNLIPPPPAAPQVTEPSVPSAASRDWAMALQQLPPICPPEPRPALAKPRKITGAHGSNLDRSGCSSTNSLDDSRRDLSQHRAISPWNNSSASFSSEDVDAAADLTISNLPPFEASVLQDMLTQLFSQYVPVVRVSVWSAGEGPIATAMFRNEWDARLVIARVHKRKLENQWSGRRLELSLGRPSPAQNLDVLRARLRAILMDHQNHTLPLLRLRDAYASRHGCPLTTSDIAKVKDTVLIHETFGRMVQLLDLSPVHNTEAEAQWKCSIHATINSASEDGCRILIPVYMEISVLAANIKVLLESHGGILPLLSFFECYESHFFPLLEDPRRGVALELLLRSISGVEVRESPSRHLAFRDREPSPDNTTHSAEGSQVSGGERGRTAPALEPMLALLERELLDLLRTAPRCCIPFSKLIPAFHHHFGRQCRVADYGFTKLPDLLAALGNTIVVLGSGSSRVITISPSAQSRRWTSDLVKILKSQPGRAIMPQEIPQLYQATYGRPFQLVDYGVCTISELMSKLSPSAVSVGADGALGLPRRAPSAEERARSLQFAAQAAELLCYTPNLRMDFSRFVPAYHAHFGRQLRVAHYGCVKLLDLFDLVSDVVSVAADAAGERSLRLACKPARSVMGRRLLAICPTPLTEFPGVYAAAFGALPLPDSVGAANVEGLIYASGGCVTNGVVEGPGGPRWATAVLSACAALAADRSVAARGSTLEYFAVAYRRVAGADADVAALAAAGVLSAAGTRVQLTPAFRTVWRLAQLLADCKEPVLPMELYLEYTKRYEPEFPCSDLGFESLEEFLRYHASVFSSRAGGRWALCGACPRPAPATAPAPAACLHDTPPGHQGSRVFESPKNIWCSPPASALPTPNALLSKDKRRTRLAAQFDAV